GDRGSGEAPPLPGRAGNDRSRGADGAAAAGPRPAPGSGAPASDAVARAGRPAGVGDAPVRGLRRPAEARVAARTGARDAAAQRSDPERGTAGSRDRGSPDTERGAAGDRGGGAPEREERSRRSRGRRGVSSP